MTSLLQRGIGRAATLQIAAGGVSVSYERGTQGLTLTATPSDRDFLSQNRDGLIEEVRGRDYLIAVTDLIFDEVAVLPERGDRIRHEDGSQWEVLPLDSEQCFRIYGEPAKFLRVHTKRVVKE